MRAIHLLIFRALSVIFPHGFIIHHGLEVIIPVGINLILLLQFFVK